MTAAPIVVDPGKVRVIGPELRPLFFGGTVASCLGIVGLVLGFSFDPTQTFVGYLAAFMYVVTISLGALTLLMICNAMTAKWPVVVRRLLEALSLALPFYAVLFVPIVIGFDRLYSWADPTQIVDPAVRELVQHKLPYLNEPFWLARAVIYFASWTVAAGLLWRWSIRNDRGPNPLLSSHMRALSSAMLPVVALTLTFAGIDWVMSLSPTWISTMYGIYVWSGGFVAAISLVTLMAYGCERAGLLPWMSPSHYHALGRLMLAFTIFWTYSGFFQYMIIWIGDLPLDVTFYVVRTKGNWQPVSVLLALGQFVLPFFALLPWRIKRDGRKLSVIAAWLVAVHYIDVHWLVAPTARATGWVYRWVDLPALLFVGGVATLVVAGLLRGRAIVPVYDPLLEAGVRYKSL